MKHMQTWNQTNTKKERKKKKKISEERIIVGQNSIVGTEMDLKSLQALIDEVIAKPLNDHVALSWSNRFFVDAKN